jgi:hypothetical protein
MIWTCQIVNTPVEVDGTGVDGYFRKLLIEAIDAWIKE